MAGLGQGEDMAGEIDYTDLVRSERPDPPVAEDSIDLYLLKTDPTIITALDLYYAREHRKARIRLEMETALWVDELITLAKMTEPIPYDPNFRLESLCLTGKGKGSARRK